MKNRTIGLLAMVVFGLGLGSARADSDRFYLRYEYPVHLMKPWSDYTTRLMCDPGDVFLSGGHYFQNNGTVKPFHPEYGTADSLIPLRDCDGDQYVGADINVQSDGGNPAGSNVIIWINCEHKDGVHTTYCNDNGWINPAKDPNRE